MHRINHPQTIHHCEDVFDIDPAEATEGRPVGLAHFSPDCRHFSKAKGGKPLEKKIRGLVLVMLRWAKAVRPRVMSMECVEELKTWGPLIRLCKQGEWGWYPDPAHKGRTWQAFLQILGGGINPSHPDLPEILSVLDGHVTLADCVRGMGYKFDDRVIRACDFGAPTIRRRLFLIARCDGKPIVWPAATHGDPQADALRHLRLKPWRTISECIDWQRPCPSIFLTGHEAKEAHCKRPLAKATLSRIAQGIDRYVLRAAEPFLVSLTHQGGDRVEPVSEPAKTITGAHRGEKGLVAPTLSKFHGDHCGRRDGAGRNHQVDASLPTLDTSNRFALSEARLAPFVTEHANASSQRNMPADEPLRTACAAVKGGHFALVSANLMVNTSDHPGAAAAEPAPTIATGGHHALVTGTLVQTGYGERDGQAPRALDPQKPLGTVVAGGGKHAVVAGTLVHAAHGELTSGGRKRGRGAHDVRELMPTVLASPDAALAAASLIKLRGDAETHAPGHRADEPLHTVSAGGIHHGLVTAHLTQFRTGSVGSSLDQPAPTVTAGTHAPETHGGAAGTQGLVAVHLAQNNFDRLGRPVDEPVSTITSTGHQQTAVAAFLAQHNGGFNENPGHKADAPLSTISTKGVQQQVVAASVAAYYGSDQHGQGAGEPARTSRTRANLGAVQSTAVVPVMTAEQVAGAHRVAAFLRQHGVEVPGEFATVKGYVVVDIGMRMLTPTELFRAQGFADDYIIDRAWVIDPKTGDLSEVRLTKEQQIRMCGNSVCPDVMQALVSANVPELAVESRRRKASTRQRRNVPASTNPRPELFACAA